MAINFEDPVNKILCEDTRKGLSDQDIKYFEQAIISAFVKKYQLNLLNDQLKMLLIKLINSHFCKYSHIYEHVQMFINKQALQESNHTIDSQKINDKLLLEPVLKQQQSESLVKQEKQIQLQPSNNEPKKKKVRCHHGHRMFSEFLNASMKRLNIENILKSFCKKINAWTSGHSSGHGIDFFLKKLIAIKSFFPILFQKICIQFLKMIQELKSLQTTNEVQEYGKSKLLFRYQNCVKIYSETDDILKAAEFIYQKSPYRANITVFEQYQTEMRQKVMRLNEQKQNQPSANINLDTNK